MRQLLIQFDCSIKDALKQLSKCGEKCLVVVNSGGEFLGTISDGDVRKAILNGIKLNDSIKNIYNENSTYFNEGTYTIEEVKEIFLKYKFDLIPVINPSGQIVDILFWEKVFDKQKTHKSHSLTVPVVIMAGGRGTRLEPFTKVLPKPLVPVHEKPIIEHIIERFTDLGCSEFYVTVNYKGKILKAYFEELQPAYQVHFVEEREPLGTAGSLRFLEGKFEESFFVTNCDVIIKADYANIYEFHKDGGYDVTLIASTKEYIIPYGTCELNSDGHLSHINEKPRFDFLINTGLYVINPDVLELIPETKFYHITHLIEDAKIKDKKIGVYPINDDIWIDVGEWAEYQKAVENFY